MTQLKLISHTLCPYVQRARIVLAEKAVAHELEFIDLANKPDWFLEVSPLGKVPVLLVDGKPLFESAVIAEYLDEVSPGTLHPVQPFQRAENRAWIEFASSTLDVVAGFYNAGDREVFARRTAQLQDRMQALDAVLVRKPYFNGPGFSLVDAAFAPLFRYFDVFDRYAQFQFFVRAPRVLAWRRELRQRPSVVSAVVEDYPQRLHQFILARGSLLAELAAAYGESMAVLEPELVPWR